MNTGFYTRESIREIRFEYWDLYHGNIREIRFENQNLYQGKHQGNTFCILGSLPGIDSREYVLNTGIFTRESIREYVLNTRILTRESIREIRFEYWDLY